MEAAPIRRPAVAGRFYPGDPAGLIQDLREYLGAPPGEGEIAAGALACVAPHAGYMYSGHVAGAVYRRLPPFDRYLILGPNHYGRGAPLAINSAGAWLTPLGAAEIDSTLGKSLKEACPELVDDVAAHAQEHSLEVQVPFLQEGGRRVKISPIAIGTADYGALVSLGDAIASVMERADWQVLMVASSDMNHYEPDGVTRVKDRKAIDRILELDAQGLWEVIEREKISMCGFGPVVAMLQAAKRLGAKATELVKYATSADAGGPRESVVGYAGIIVSR